MKILAIGDFHGKFPVKLRKRIEKENVDLILSNGDYAGIKEWRPLLRKLFKARERGEDVWAEDLIDKKKYKGLLKKDYASGKMPLRELNKFKIKTFCIYGNSDWYKCSWNISKRDYGLLIKKLRYMKDVDHKTGRFRKMRIVGFGQYMDPDVYFTKKGKKAICEKPKYEKRRKKRYKEDEKKLMKLMKNKPDILIIHYTPYKCLDKMKEKGFMLTGSYMGVSSFNKAIKKYKPRLVVCGHMHENQGKCKINGALIINPGAAEQGKAAIIEFDEKKKRVEKVRFLK